MKVSAFITIVCLLISTFAIRAIAESPPQEQVREHSDTSARVARVGTQENDWKSIREAVIEKDYERALSLLEDEESFCNASKDFTSLLSAITLHVAILDMLREHDAAIKLLASYPLTKCDELAQYAFFHTVLGVTSMRKGDYGHTVHLMSNQIDTLKQELTLETDNNQNNQSESVRKKQAIRASLSQCYYYKLLAKFLQSEGKIEDVSFMEDYIQCIQELKAANLSSLQEATIKAQYKEFFLPLTDLLGKSPKPFRVIPNKKQPQMLIAGKTKDDQCTVDVAFKFDIQFLNKAK